MWREKEALELLARPVNPASGESSFAPMVQSSGSARRAVAKRLAAKSWRDRHSGVIVGPGPGVGFVPGPAGFDPFLFAFGPSRSPFGPAGPPEVFGSRPFIPDEVTDAFHRGDFAGALGRLDRLQENDGDDPDLGQARSLALFALGEYGAAGAEARATLTQYGERWDWEILRRFYPDASTYVNQYRGLQTEADEIAPIGRRPVLAWLSRHGPGAIRRGPTVISGHPTA